MHQAAKALQLVFEHHDSEEEAELDAIGESTNAQESSSSQSDVEEENLQVGILKYKKKIKKEQERARKKAERAQAR